MNTALTEAEAEAYVSEHCFAEGPPRRIGVELEWLLRFADDARSPITRELSQSVVLPMEEAGPLPGGGHVTREPGGQVEISSSPAESLAECVADVASDLAAVAEELAPHGLVVEGGGLDANRSPLLVVDDLRYRAMTAYYDDNEAAYPLMCGTASVQVNLDAGEAEGILGHRRRWSLAHRLGPVLTAAFANSPMLRGRPTGLKSTRQSLWWRLDPSRTRPAMADDEDPRRTWTRYALDAGLLCMRRQAPADWEVPRGLTFRDWLRGAYDERPPTMDDLRYHLGTLFPPVRPRGWLELRMIDAQPGGDWVVPLALCSALFDDPRAAAEAWEALEPLTGGDARSVREVWERAVEHGPADRDIGEASRACFAAAAASLERTGAPAEVREALRGFAARHVDRGRCPADDLLDAVSVPTGGEARP